VSLFGIKSKKIYESKKKELFMYLFLSVSQRDFISFRENYFVDAVGSEANMVLHNYTFIRFYAL
jgi:hypothetical protein